ncbi:MAG: ChaN family lipoprotein [Bdellovibrio sp.]
MSPLKRRLVLEINQNYAKIKDVIGENSLNDLQKWIRIRKDLYLQMEQQVRHRLGQDTPELLRYNKVYAQEFQKKWAPVSKEVLWEQMREAQVVLVGDFHALHQSQKAQLRILRHVPPERKIILAVEFFEAGDQDKIDAYLSGKLSEREFLKVIQWQTRWGFPWEHYRSLLRWAQKRKVSVQGLNRNYKKRNATTLRSRDAFAGKKIADLVKKNPEYLVFVIYGDLHLAQPHIPAEIEKHLGSGFSRKILRLFQNAERIYFQLLQKEMEATTDLVRLSRNTFCLMSVPPWVKWQNYLMYLERTYDLGLVGDDEEDEDFLDYTDHVGRYVQIIADELKLAAPVDRLSVYTAQDAAFWAQVREHYDLKALRWIEILIGEGVSFYLPEIAAAYLARGTVNHAASLAMQYIHAQVSGQKRFLSQPPQDFLGMIWLEGVTYFGSKIINHKRKADTLADIKAVLSSSASNAGRESMQLALAQKMHELMMITRGRSMALSVKPRKKWSYLLAARLLGGMLGERLYAGYRKKLISPRTLQLFLKRDVNHESFKVAYYDMLEVVESLPAPFLSKKEKL